MTVEITVPELGESVLEATVGEWRVQEGDAVAIGDLLVDLETDKVDVEIGAKAAGVLISIQRKSGEDVRVGDVLAEIDPRGETPEEEETSPPLSEPESDGPVEGHEPESEQAPSREKVQATPVAQRFADDEGVDLSQIKGSGPNGRVTRKDVENYLKDQEATVPDKEPEVEDKVDAPGPEEPGSESDSSRRVERVRLSRRRRTIARRLVEAQQTAASLTTFNDVDMSAVIALRKRRGERFRERYDVKLGFMSFFVKGVIGALKAFPRLNAEIDGDDMVLKHFYDLGVAIGAEKGLVVPVIRDADRKSFAEIEQNIRDFVRKAQDGSLTLEDLRGGTFTITNGGVYGSLLSTPILNPPQVGILGLHRIEDRPVAVEDEVVIRPMMYMALSYDHRIVDGREAVQFLARTKELVEEPEALLLEA